jgi:hypothetical protein
MTKSFLFQKHSKLENWESYLENVKEFESESVASLKKDLAELAMNDSDTLKNSLFFSCYTHLGKVWRSKHRQIAIYLDTTIPFMQEAAKYYFNYKYQSEFPEIDFKPALRGSRPATLCIVRVNNTELVYRMKTNHEAGSTQKGNVASKLLYNV